MAAPQEIPASLQPAAEALYRIGKRPEDIAWDLLSSVRDFPADSIAPVQELKAACGVGGDAVERLLVWHAVHRALPLLPGIPVHASVHRLLEKELRQLLAPKNPIEAGTLDFKNAAKFSTFRRFPSGPMDWEVSRIPRSWPLRPAFPGQFRLSWFLISQSVGFGPCFYMHVAPNPRKRALVVESEVLKSYYRMARSLELQPEVTAIIATAWFHDQAALRDNPHLEVLNRPYLRHGGAVFNIAPADADSGVLERSPQRRADFEAGKLRYRIGFAIWPRKAAVAWAHEHPELGG